MPYLTRQYAHQQTETSMVAFSQLALPTDLHTAMQRASRTMSVRREVRSADEPIRLEDKSEAVPLVSETALLNWSWRLEIL